MQLMFDLNHMDAHDGFPDDSSSALACWGGGVSFKVCFLRLNKAIPFECIWKCKIPADQTVKLPMQSSAFVV